MKLQLSRIAYPVTVLGPGRRLGVWVQGCHIGCPGCASVDTWDASGGESVETAALAPDLAEIIVRDRITGITLTGGEPTEQADALANLVTRLRRHASDRQLDVLMFTGLTEKAAKQRAEVLWDVIDAAVCGPYRPDRPGTAPLIATSNQTMVTPTALGAARLAEPGEPSGPTLQARVAGGEITMVGLPSPDDLPRLEGALRARGVVLEGRSWQTP